MLILLFCYDSSPLAVELGSSAPHFSLKNLDNEVVELVAPRKGTLLLLYFFDPSERSAEILRHLNAAAENSSGALSLLAISRGNADAVREMLGVEGQLAPIVLTDNKGVTFDYGISRKLPAAVIIGSGARVGSSLTPATDPGEILMACADTFFSLLLPERAGVIYRAISTDFISAEIIRLGEAYVALVSGSEKMARELLISLTSSSPTVSSEAHAALGFMEFRQGRDSAALAACGRTTNSGFAEYVMGMVNARTGQCKASLSLFERSAKGRFSFRWQQAAALNMSARSAEEQGSNDKAVASLRRAAGLAPLNPTINANLLAHHWNSGNIPAASRYARILKSIDPDDMLIRSLVGEFESQLEFNADAAALKRLEKNLVTKPARQTAKDRRRSGTIRKILIPDIDVAACVPELASLPVASAALLRQTLEASGAFIAVPRPEALAAANHLGVARERLQNPAYLLQVAKALSADTVTLAEVGNYGNKYLVNVRLAEVTSGEVIAVASQRIASLDELAPTIDGLAARLIKKVKSGD